MRIPKENLFSKNSSVSAAGVYTAAPAKLSKLSYISMMCGNHAGRSAAVLRGRPEVADRRSAGCFTEPAAAQPGSRRLAHGSTDSLSH